MSFLAWLNEHLTFSRKRSELHDALRASDELLETKRTLAEFTRTLNPNMMGDQDKVIHIRANVMEQSFLSDPSKNQGGE